MPMQIVKPVTEVSAPTPPAAHLEGMASLMAVPFIRVAFADVTQLDIRLWLDSARASVFASVLGGLRGTGVPVYAELKDNRIDDIIVPTIGNVVTIEEPDARGDRLVSMDNSATPAVLRADVPDHDELLHRLEEGLGLNEQDSADHLVAIVTRTVRTAVGVVHEIIYVEIVAALKSTACPPLPAVKSQEEIVHSLTPLGRDEIERRVAALVQRTCDPDLTVADCIPFSNVVDYCWYRAHVVAMDFARDKITAAKLWVYPKDRGHRLRIPTDCLPDGVTNWNYHAVTVVRTTQFDIRVIDPSLFRQGSVPLSTFVQMMRPAAVFAYTDAETYLNFPNAKRKAACPEDVRRDGLKAAAQLHLMKTLPEGPPPYDRIWPV